MFKTDFPVTKEQLSKAMDIVIKNLEDWPEDEWFTIDDDLNLNLFHDGITIFATVYPVVDGSPDTSRFLRIFELSKRWREWSARDDKQDLYGDHQVFEIAELINWGYETSGDFDEAMRVYIEQTQLNGKVLVILPEDAQNAKKSFETEFPLER